MATVMVYFGQDWAGHEAHSLAEVSESLAGSLVAAGVATLVELADGLDEADGSDVLDEAEVTEPVPTEPAPAAAKKRRPKR